MESLPLKPIPVSNPGPQRLFPLATSFLLLNLTKTSDGAAFPGLDPQLDHFSSLPTSFPFLYPYNRAL